MGSISEVEVMKTALNVPVESQASLLRDRTIDFRVKLLRSLRLGWEKDDTEAKFLKLVDMIESDGCALFGGLINLAIFEKLVAKYDKAQSRSGNNAFMNSYVNLATEHDFFLGGNYIEAFSHPLLIALVSYLLGGSIRIVDFRGKDNDPMSINAQDNMLHVDNTPFKEEYKGNRGVLVDEEGLPWSTERESLFVSHDAIDGLLDFQKEIKGISRVVEAKHPDQPLAVLFPAGALVHHRYRTMEGDPRSCIIVAFHLSSKHPGQILELPPISGRKKSLIEFVVGYQDEHSNDELLALLSSESPHIEEKIQELFHSSHPSKLIDIAPLALKGERLTQWRNAVVGAPSPITHKCNNNLRLSGTDFSDLDALTETLAAIMDYDKHCNLQMVLYEDGLEEIRKPGRKIIGEMKKDAIRARLHAWTPELRSGSFSAHDLVEPRTLRIMCDAMAALAKHLAQNLDTGAEGKSLNHVVG